MQLVSKTPEQFRDLSNNKVRLKQAGVQHGDMVSRSLAPDPPLPLHAHRRKSSICMQIYMQYPFERKVESVIKKSVFEGRGFGAKMTVEQLIAKQTRIERCVEIPTAASSVPCALCT